MKVSTGAALAPLFMAASAYAQLYTTTYPWAQGDTVVISTGTDALGDPTSTVLRTVTTGTGTGTALASSSSSANTLLNPLNPAVTSTSSTSTNTRLRTTATATRPTTTTGPRVGDDTALPPPMRTTTYWYDPGDGSEWSVATWTATFTGAPTVATALVPQGTIQTYAQYATSVNARVLASAVASESMGAAGLQAGLPSAQNLVGWAVLGAGAVMGAGLVL